MKRRAARLGLALLLGALALWGGASLCLRLVPIPSLATRDRPAINQIFTDRSGNLLRVVWADVRGDACYVPLSRISPYAVQATLVAEDRRFYRHGGVDYTAVARAAFDNVRAGRIVSGGSTLTQQLIVNEEGHGGHRGFPEKAWEALQALRLETVLDKERILTLYLNCVPYGNNTRGIEAASRFYFGRPAAALSLAQAALLAGLPRSPTLYDPLTRRERAVERQHWILDEMRRLGHIGDDAWREARAEPVKPAGGAPPFEAPAFVEFVARDPQVAPTLAASRGGVVRTTLDREVQAEAQRIVLAQVRRLTSRQVTNGAVVVLDNETGGVVAMVGSADFSDARHSGQVNAALARRQPGSTLKPFAYGLALDRGMSAAALLADVPARYRSVGADYVPENYDGRFHGPVRLRVALACSYNVPALRVAEKVGMDDLLSGLHRAGFASLDRPPRSYGLGLVLGSGDVTLLELTRGYCALANGGVYRPDRVVLDVGGSVVPRATGEQRVMSAPAAALLADILSDRQARGPSFGVDSPLRLPFPCAVKTGTSRDFRDNWCVGFTTRYTVGVWMGNMDASPMRGVPGATGAAPVFHEVMAFLHRDHPPAAFPAPPGMHRARICPRSGEAVGRYCPGGVTEWLQAGEAPRPCTVHRLVGGLVVEALPPRYYGWMKERHLTPVPLARNRARNGSGPLIRFPEDGDVFTFDADLALASQQITLSVTAGEGVSRLSWWLDGTFQGSLAPPFTAPLPLRRGSHRVRVTDDQGRSASTSWTVR